LVANLPIELDLTVGQMHVAIATGGQPIVVRYQHQTDLPFGIESTKAPATPVTRLLIEVPGQLVGQHHGRRHRQRSRDPAATWEAAPWRLGPPG
jgi:hypothetical protein